MTKQNEKIKDTVKTLLSNLKVFQGVFLIEKSFRKKELTTIAKILGNAVNEQQVRILIEDI